MINKKDKYMINEILKRTYSENKKFLMEQESKKIINSYNIPTTREKTVNNLHDAVKFSREIGFPVVLKISSPNVIHKSDIGGVITGIQNPQEVKKAYIKITSNLRNKSDSFKLRGILVQEMVPEGYEVIIGATRDKQFGPVVMFGLGGVFVEVLNDVSFRIVPFSSEEALEMIKETKAFKVLKGFRDRKTVDMKVLAKILTQTGNIMIDFPEINEIDINPLIINEKNMVAVDARIILS